MSVPLRARPRRSRRARGARAVAGALPYVVVAAVSTALLTAALMTMTERSALPSPTPTVTVTATDFARSSPIERARSLKDLTALDEGDLVLYHATPGDRGFPCSFIRRIEGHLAIVDCGQGRVQVNEVALSSATNVS